MQLLDIYSKHHNIEEHFVRCPVDLLPLFQFFPTILQLQSLTILYLYSKNSLWLNYIINLEWSTACKVVGDEERNQV